MPQQKLIYLDHNILNSAIKKEIPLRDLFNNNSELIPVYSSENLNEIQRSLNYENQFLTLLKDIRAKYLQPEHLPSGFTGKFFLSERDPFDAFREYETNKPLFSNIMSALLTFIQKFYGGLEEKKFTDLENQIRETLKDLLLSVIAEIEKDKELPDDLKAIMKSASTILVKMFAELNLDLGQTLDNNSSESSMQKLESLLGFNSIQLNNIEEPDVLKKIWDKIRFKLPNNISLEKFFGIEFFGTERELSMIEKVNAIYHSLNFIGYYRDKKLKTERGTLRAFGDMTHAGLAIFCQFFFCKDRDLVMKAAAAYQYLGIKTKIVHFKFEPPK